MSISKNLTISLGICLGMAGGTQLQMFQAETVSVLFNDVKDCPISHL